MTLGGFSESFWPRNIPIHGDSDLYSLADTITLLNGNKGYKLLDFVSIHRKQEYFEHILEHANGPELELALDQLDQFAQPFAPTNFFANTSIDLSPGVET